MSLSSFSEKTKLHHQLQHFFYYFILTFTNHVNLPPSCKSIEEEKVNLINPTEGESTVCILWFVSQKTHTVYIEHNDYMHNH